MFPLLLMVLGQTLEPTTIATDLRGGYQVLAVDLNRDGRPDLIGLAQAMDRLDWFENPGPTAKEWKRHTLLTGLRQPINVAALDTNGDGIPELLLAHEFSSTPAKSQGIVSLLTHQGDPRGPWMRKDIDAIPTSHRIKVANGAFINAPLADPKTSPPDYRGKVPLTAYPAKTLKPTLLNDEDSGVMHGLHVDDFNGDGRTDILTASFLGIALLEAQKDGSYKRRLLHSANTQPWPKSGSSDVTVVRAAGKKFLATIDPWHGHEFAIYTPRGKGYEREVLESKLDQGHTVLAVDLDGDGNEEVIYGSRMGAVTLRYARYQKASKKWELIPILDGKIATSSCVSADFNADRRMDIACIGGSTQNLIVFENRP
jgi:hypothetical protein